ncbi:hypothetical protein [Mycoplasma suis]|uniref:Uncharacterized protein n=2 Tax=Mycoplasma suis TaxID=57372 RepID=F0QRE0_MYCSL|nr:hypothetical protein [Mycoplasma suis]ADX98060.1 hypothetical protein MSU_0526 [Mycoplasma suis str. Illinois]
MALAAIPVTGFLALEPSHSKLKIQDLGNNQKTKIYLFSDDLKISQDEGQGVKFVSTQKENGTTQNNQNTKKKPILVAELSLKDLNRQDLKRYCIPKETESNHPQQATQQTSSQGGTNSSIPKQEECSDWKQVESSFWWGNDPKTELISFLLSEFSKFLQVEHSYNFLALENQKVEFEHKDVKNLSKLQEIKQKCGISLDSQKDGVKNENVLRNLFLNSGGKKSECKAIPTSMKLKINLKKENSQNLVSLDSQRKPLSLDEIYKQGVVQGRITYSLFEKKNKKEVKGKEDKPISFIVKSGHKYSFSPLEEKDKEKDLTYLDKKYYSYQFNTLKLEDFQVKKSSNQTNGNQTSK